jgi:hypothetical protein
VDRAKVCVSRGQLPEGLGWVSRLQNVDEDACERYARAVELAERVWEEWERLGRPLTAEGVDDDPVRLLRRPARPRCRPEALENPGPLASAAAI